MAGGLLGVGELRPRPLPRLEDISLPASRVAPPLGFVTGDRHARILHTYGRAYRDVLRGFRGDFSPAPDLVAMARSEADVVELLAWCAREGVTCVPYGGGTSVVGGVEAGRERGPVVSLDLSGLGQVLEVDPVSRAARIQAGAFGPAIDAGLAPHGLTLRHFPQSYEHSTLGGWIATRAGGHFSTVYTHIDDLVESVRMVTPTGIWQSRRLPASGAGPSPDRIVLGSEGILGVITEAWVRLQRRPTFRASASVHFRELAPAVAAARDVAQSGLFPSNCRLLDAREAALNGVASDGSHILILGFESADHALDSWIARALELATTHGGICPRGPRIRAGEAPRADDAAAAWRTAFIEAPYLQSALVSMGVIADTFETACTWDRFDQVHAAITSAVLEAGAAQVTCRFTHVYPDGPAPYYTFLAGPDDMQDELVRWTRIKDAASRAIEENGATITHHHAVGRMHRPWYDRERPAPFARALSAMKRELDPAGILNPGVLVG
jgi:alkyldihydroxyacetonephosphate synthase